VAHASTPPKGPNTKDPEIELSVVVPVLNETENIRPLIDEIQAALKDVCVYEIVYVDDGSNDGSLDLLTKLAQSMTELRVIAHARRSGQSAGVRSGVLAARGRLIATLDGDGQNDPADIPKLLEAHREHTGTERLMVTGWRAERRDSWAKRRASRLANAIRRAMLRDDNPDTGCSLKLYERELFLRLPYFDHMHRYLPALAKRENCAVRIVRVNHRHRTHGVSKYKIMDRLVVGLSDLLGVWWLIRRSPGPLDSKEL
jgi:dolichol-phosphate mannosyltransferase